MMKIKSINLVKQQKIIWFFSSALLVISIVGILFSSFYSPIKKPINLGMDFLGGTEIRVERICSDEGCSIETADEIADSLRQVSEDKITLNKIRLQIQNDNKIISLKVPFLNVEQTANLIKNLDKVLPLNSETQDSRSIGPLLGKTLLIKGARSLLVALVAIAIYISIRFDKKYALLALFALFHDLLIVFGIFSWLGIILSVQVNSLFAVSLLTIAGYSVNDTVVIFDRIRENLKSSKEDYNETIQLSVNESFRRTTFTSITTLIPLLTLILFGSYSLFWFSLSLSLGIIVGSYSSILLAPSFLIKK